MPARPEVVTQPTLYQARLYMKKSRRDFVNPKSIQSYLKRNHSDEQELGLMHYRRPDEYTVNHKDNCIFCGCPNLYDGKKHINCLKLEQYGLSDQYTECMWRV